MQTIKFLKPLLQNTKKSQKFFSPKEKNHNYELAPFEEVAYFGNDPNYFLFQRRSRRQYVRFLLRSLALGC